MREEIAKVLEVPEQGRMAGLFVSEQGGALRIEAAKMIRSGHCVVVSVDTFDKNTQSFIVVGRGSKGQEEFQIMDADAAAIVTQGNRRGFCSISTAKPNISFGAGVEDYTLDERFPRFLDQHNILKKAGARIDFEMDASQRLTVKTSGREAMVSVVPIRMAHFLGVSAISPDFNTLR